MPRDSSGTYTLPNAPFVAGTASDVTKVNGNFADIATELTGSLSRDGHGGLLAPLGFSDGTQSLPAVTFRSEQSTGWWRNAAGDARFSLLGVARLIIAGAGHVLMSAVANGASAVGHILDTTNALSTAGALIASFRNAGVEKASIDKDGVVSCAAPTAGGHAATKGYVDGRFVAAASFDLNGNVLANTGSLTLVSATHGGAGVYTITVAGLTANAVVLVSSWISGAYSVGYALSAGSLAVNIFTSAGAGVNAPFSVFVLKL